MAESYYRRALELISTDEHYQAIELLREAVRISPQADLYVLLGKLQAKNPRWLRAAAESLQQAMVLGAKDPELPAALQEVQDRLASGEWRNPDLTTGTASRGARGNRRDPGTMRPTSRSSIPRKRSAASSGRRTLTPGPSPYPSPPPSQGEGRQKAEPIPMEPVLFSPSSPGEGGGGIGRRGSG